MPVSQTYKDGQVDQGLCIFRQSCHQEQERTALHPGLCMKCTEPMHEGTMKV